MKNIPSTIASIRKSRGLTQVQLAEMAGLTQPHLSKIEKGAQGTPVRVYEQIAQALGVEVSDLLQDTRAEQEQFLLDAFRSLPPDRQQGWLDMARLVHGGSSKSSQRGK